MKQFTYETATSIENAEKLLVDQTVRPIAGGSDLLGLLKDDALPQYPDTIVNLKGIPNLNHITEQNGLRIGALTTLCEIAEHPTIQKKYTALAQAARSVASPLIRNQATLGGNICQEVRCWYYRSPDQVSGKMDCARKHGQKCYAATGLLHHHSIFGGQKVCTTPCTRECPAGVDIPAYMEQVRGGHLEDAAKILLRNNPIPSMTSRVCTHFCQEGCNRNTYDERVGVGYVERYLGDYILEHAAELMPSPETESGKHIAIVGSGPAGLSAAYYLRQAGHRVTVYEKMPEAGGLLMYAIPAYRLPKEQVQRMVAAIAGMGVIFCCNTDVGDSISLEKLKKENDAVFLDTGAWKPVVIGIEGEELTRFGLDFLVEVKRWMHKKPGTDIVVVGGGNVAVDVAVTAKRLGASRVTMVTLEAQNELPATAEEVARAQAEGVQIMPQWGPKEILRENGSITGIELKRCIAVRDAQGRFAPSYDETERTVVKGDSVFLAVGQQADFEFLGKDPILETQRGRISIEPITQLTSLDGMYAGGDVTTGPATVVKAVAAGKNAADAICAKLGTPARKEASAEKDPLLHFAASGTQPSQSVAAHIRPLAQRSIDLEDDLGLEWDEVLKEANRCLNCGCIAVHPSDIATALLALDATVQTNKRTYPMKEFLADSLAWDELVTEISIPQLPEGAVSAYDKFRQRGSIDFASVAVASVYRMKSDCITDARIVLGAVAPIPIEATDAEAYVCGKKVSPGMAEHAAALALAEAQPLPDIAFKVDVAEVLVKRSILRAAGLPTQSKL